MAQTTAQVLKNGEAEVSTLGVGGAAPVTTQTFIADPSGGATVDAEARAAIGSILDLLIAFGLMASS